MTVKELRKELERYNDNDLVILTVDSEGNGFSPLCHLSEDAYVPESSYRGTVYPRKLTPELEREGWEDDDVRTEEDGAYMCVVLWPVN